MDLDVNTLVTVMRECAHVERAHTIPHHGSYTNGQHSFNMMTLAWALMPVVTRNIMIAIMFHDFPERWTGDMPGHAKADDPEFAKRMASIEARIETKLGWRVALTGDERMWLTALDKLEFYLWCRDQFAMGNQNVVSILEKLAEWFQTHRVPSPVVEFLRNYSWYRTTDSLPK